MTTTSSSEPPRPRPKGEVSVLGPDGSPAATEGRITERSRERDSEDERYTPVIIKRNDEIRRHPDDILSAAIEEGVEQLERQGFSLFLSAVAGGLILGFSAMAVAVVVTATGDSLSGLQQRIAAALVYPLGFVVCLLSGTELFTEHTATALYPVLDRRASVLSLLRLWAVVVAGNLVGAAGSALLLTSAEGVVGARAGYIEIGHHLVDPSAASLLASAVIAGWLMATAGWLILASPSALSQTVSIYIITFLIGLGGLHHSIAGSVEMFTAWLVSDAFTPSAAAAFIGLALLGNLIGGTLFVAVLNYGHIRHSRAEDRS